MTTKPIRSYDVVALSVPIVFNKEGDHDPNGLMYALEANVPVLKNLKAHFFHEAHEHRPGLPPFEPGSEKKPHPLVRPLVLRACKGETVRIYFENQLNQPASIHLQSDGYNINQSDGAAVGRNPDSTVAPGDRTVYEWAVDREGVFLFHDMANLSGGEDGTNVHGLFGALIVEPEGATWTAPETGEPLVDGLYADVHPIDACSFREYAIFFHDEVEVHELEHSHESGMVSQEVDIPTEHNHAADDKAEQKEADAHANIHVMPISYRSEPMHNRKSEFGETQHHSSWLFGDPATPILRAYRHDPAKIRLVHAGVKETHVFHLHVHQWYTVPENPKSPIIDSISISPQTAMTIEPLFGAGSRQGAIGDIIWHCHLYPHFHRGMWGMWRVHDVLEEGQWQDGRPRLYPDGTPIPPLKPLPARKPLQAPTAERPGFPLFIPGEYGKKSPYPPGHPQRLDGATQLEQNQFVSDRQPGEAFVEIGPRQPADRTFNIVVRKADVLYNDNGWHDPDGHFFVLAEDEEAVLSGKKPIEPLYIRANAGDVIELTLTNKLPIPQIPAQTNAFNTPHPTRECSLHQHFVKFDPLVSDGASVGWNYLSAVNPGETITYRWFADEQEEGELGAVFFHDHLMANFRQKHGLFGALIVEPKEAKHLNPETLEEVPASRTSGSKAVIQLPDGSSFREFCLGVADFVPLFDRRGEAINPPEEPATEFDHEDDNGAMAVNYRCEPIRLRQGDPSRWFSSTEHGDPDTPVFETYPGDPIHIRLIQGSHEEQHSFMVHGLRWNEWRNDPRSPLGNQQTLGISEAFTFKIEEAYTPGDYLWLFASSDDLWLGCWGIIRAHETPMLNLPALPKRKEVSPLPEHPDDAPVRHFHVVARQREILYQGYDLTDPFGLVYELKDHPSDEPLVLRCRAGEWVEVTLTNELPEKLFLEPNAPEVPVELDRDRRLISNRVSLHANLLQYDVRTSDGSYVGKNPDRTVGPGESITYRWYADRELGVVYLQDMADFRNHRHHGLVGALVVEPEDATPVDPIAKQPCWHGARAIIQRPGQKPVQEMVLLMQDGLRLFSFGSVFLPLPDPDDGELDPEDQGQKGFNYRCEPIHPVRGMRVPQPATPVWTVREGDRLWLRLVVAADKPRNHSFTVHGHVWQVEPQLGDQSSVTGAIAALSTGSVRNLSFVASKPGDYAYRTGVLKWALSQGLWGIIRVRPAGCFQKLLQWFRSLLLP